MKKCSTEMHQFELTDPVCLLNFCKEREESVGLSGGHKYYELHNVAYPYLMSH